MQERVLVVGGHGLLGKPLCQYLESQGHLVFAYSRRQSATDFSNQQTCIDLFEKNKPTVVINLAALTNVDACEEDPEQAYQANAGLVENLVKAIGSQKIFLIQASTDMVYDGEGPHIETRTQPLNQYAKTKLQGEKIAQTIPAAILRINFFGHSLLAERKSFSDWLIQSFQSKTPIKLFNDVYFSPLNIETLVQMIEKVVAEKKPGTFNLGSRQGMSKAGFAFYLAEKLNLNCQNAKAMSVDEVHLKAVRPKDMIMNVTQFENTFNVELPTLKEEIEKLGRKK